MISAWWLCLIVPVSGWFGVFIAALFMVNKNKDK